MSLNIKQIIDSNSEIDINFLEIGTSNFDSLLEKADDNVIGISVEPIKYYLDTLPNKPNILKVATAITSNKKSEKINIYYIPENVIKNNNLYWWLKGCNRVNEYHPLHIQYNLQKFVNIEEVPLINIDDFLLNYKIKGIDYLKIDTEGHDVIILDGLFKYLKNKSKVYYPKKIMFESNSNIPSQLVDDIISKAIGLGYILISRNDSDTIIALK
jgi:FkbM family methyltransferase